MIRRKFFYLFAIWYKVDGIRLIVFEKFRFTDAYSNDKTDENE